MQANTMSLGDHIGKHVPAAFKRRIGPFAGQIVKGPAAEIGIAVTPDIDIDGVHVVAGDILHHRGNGALGRRIASPPGDPDPAQLRPGLCQSGRSEEQRDGVEPDLQYSAPPYLSRAILRTRVVPAAVRRQ